MKLLVIIAFAVLCSESILGQSLRFNIIIQVNEQLVYGEITRLHLTSKSRPSQKIDAGYIPGELTIYDTTFNDLLKSDSSSFTLHFDYNTFSGAKHLVANFSAELNSRVIKQPYLIVNIYDFRSRRYKRMYQYLTEKDHLAELRFPNSGVYIRKK